MVGSFRSVWVLAVSAVFVIALPAVLAGQEPAAPRHDHGQEAGAEHQHGHAHAAANSETGYHHGTAEHDFSDAEEWSARFDSAERHVWQKPEEVTALLEIAPGMTVVDLGAGTGYFMSYLSAAAGADGKVLALDPEPDMIRFMQQRAEREELGNVVPRQIPYDDPQLAAESVDRVLIVNTWHHIAERDAYSRKLLAALKPGGRVYVVDFTRDSPSGPPVAERIDPEQVAAELAAGGLAADTIEETLPRQYVVVGRRAD